MGHLLARFCRRAALAVVLVATMVVPVARGGAANVSGSAVEQELLGRYRYVGGAKQRQELDTAIETLVGELNFLIRGIARRRIRDSNRIPWQIAMSAQGGKLRVDLPGLRPIIAATDGKTVIWRDQYGEDVRVRQRISGRALFQQFDGEEGDRDITYRLSADGTRLTFNVTIRSARIPFPLRYRLSYRRVE